jgi:hypothetical protein
VPTKFSFAEPNILGPSEWKVIRVTLLARGILKWLLDFGESLCTPHLKLITLEEEGAVPWLEM